MQKFNRASDYSPQTFQGQAGPGYDLAVDVPDHCMGVGPDDF